MKKKQEQFEGVLNRIIPAAIETPERYQVRETPEQPGTLADRLEGFTIPEEYKTRRVQLLLKPSLYNSLQEIAERYPDKKTGRPMAINKLINEILIDFVEHSRKDNR